MPAKLKNCPTKPNITKFYAHYELSNKTCKEQATFQERSKDTCRVFESSG